MDLAALADRYRYAAHRAMAARDLLDDGVAKISRALSDTGVIGDNQLHRSTNQQLTAGRQQAERHASTLHDFANECRWRAGEIDTYLVQRTRAEQARAAHMDGEYHAALRDAREPTDEHAPCVPQAPHVWMGRS